MTLWYAASPTSPYLINARQQTLSKVECTCLNQIVRISLVVFFLRGSVKAPNSKAASYRTCTSGDAFLCSLLQLSVPQVFTYARGQHNVIQVAGPSCDFADSHQLAGLTDSPFHLTFNSTGSFYYACSVPGHCADGMLITIEVTGVSISSLRYSNPCPSTTSSPEC